MERREIFRIIAAGAVAGSQASAQHRHEAPAPVDYATYLPRFWTAAEYEMVDLLCEIIIPGAREAQVRFFIDTILHYSDPQTRQRWRAGLAAVEAAAQASFGKTFSGCDGSQQEAIVAGMAQHEEAPASDLERFFGSLKRMTVEGYTLSEAGARQGLGYAGDTSLAEFPGCTHLEHQK